MAQPDLMLALLAAGGAALLALLAALILGREAGRRDLSLRLRALSSPAGGFAEPPRAARGEGAVGLVRGLGEAMRERALFSEKELAQLGRSLTAAGFDPRRGVPVLLGAKALLLLAMPAFGYLVATLREADMGPSIAIGMVVGLMAPNWVLGLLRRSYTAALRKGLPDALDLMVVCAEAGLALESAVERVAREMVGSSPQTAQEFATLSHEMRVMPDRRQALQRMAERSGVEGFRRLGSTLAQAIKYGTPLAQALRVLSAEMRQERMLRIEERAARLPALLVLPLILFIMPCLFIVLIGPSIVSIIGQFGG